MEIDDGMMIMKSCIFPDYEFIHEFSAMTNIVKSWLNSYKKKIHVWNHGWIYQP